jgi:hypothetical protein
MTGSLTDGARVLSLWRSEGLTGHRGPRRRRLLKTGAADPGAPEGKKRAGRGRANAIDRIRREPPRQEDQ